MKTNQTGSQASGTLVGKGLERSAEASAQPDAAANVRRWPGEIAATGFVRPAANQVIGQRFVTTQPMRWSRWKADCCRALDRIFSHP